MQQASVCGANTLAHKLRKRRLADSIVQRQHSKARTTQTSATAAGCLGSGHAGPQQHAHSATVKLSLCKLSLRSPHQQRKLVSVAAQQQSNLFLPRTQTSKLKGSALTRHPGCSAKAAAGPQNVPTAVPILEPDRLTQALSRLCASQQRPSAEWLDMFLAASQVSLPSFKWHQLYELMSSILELDVELPEDWSQAFLARCGDAISDAAAPDLCQFLGMVAVQGLKPDRDWVNALTVQVLSNLSSTSAPDVAMLLWALARMGFRPSDAVLADACSRLLAVGLSDLDQDQFSQLAWAFGSFGYLPDVAFVETYANTAIYQYAFSSEGAAALLWSLAVFQAVPSPLWVKAFYAQTFDDLANIHVDGLVNVLWAIAALEVGRVKADSTQQPSTPSASTGVVQQQGIALATPAPGAMSDTSHSGSSDASSHALDANSLPRTPDATGAGEPSGTTNNTISADRVVKVNLQNDVTASKADLASTAETNSSSAADAEAKPDAQSAQNLDLRSRLAEIAQGLSLTPPPIWLARFWDATETNLSGLSKVEAIKLLWAVAVIQVPVPSAWLRQLVAVADQHLRSGDLDSLEMLYAARSADMIVSSWQAVYAGSDSQSELGIPEKLKQILISGDDTSMAVELDPASQQPTSAHDASPAVTHSRTSHDRSDISPSNSTHANVTTGSPPAYEPATQNPNSSQPPAWLAAFVSSTFKALARRPLPPDWRRMNPRYPPYAAAPRQQRTAGGT